MTDDAKSEAFEDRWPEDGDRLFVESHWSFDARLTSNPAERFYRLPLGYKLAGDILLDRAGADPGDRSNVIYPALFCYRQTIELFLKKIVDHFGDDDLRKKKKTHDLCELWKRFMQVVAERGGANSIGFAAAEKLVDEMHGADQKSDAFRFATDQGDVPFSTGEKGIDLGILREAMQGLANFFECFYLEYQHQDDLIGTE
jgi:hypothetical protein